MTRQPHSERWYRINLEQLIKLKDAPLQEQADEIAEIVRQQKIPAPSAGQVLDQATGWLFEEFRCYSHGEYVFGTNLVIDWWIDRVWYLTTPEGREELRPQEREQ